MPLSKHQQGRRLAPVPRSHGFCRRCTGSDLVSLCPQLPLHSVQGLPPNAPNSPGLLPAPRKPETFCLICHPGMGFASSRTLHMLQTGVATTAAPGPSPRRFPGSPRCPGVPAAPPIPGISAAGALFTLLISEGGVLIALNYCWKNWSGQQSIRLIYHPVPTRCEPAISCRHEIYY